MQVSLTQNEKSITSDLRMLFLGSEFPDFTADTTDGEIKFHQWMDNKWTILFSHPRDYTPVCTTELAKMAKLANEFKKRQVKIIALSCDSIEDHLGWWEDIKDFGGMNQSLPYPIIDDKRRILAKRLGMLDADERDEVGIPVTARAVFIIGPDKKMKLSILYPATTGRSFEEILRVVDSLQLTAVKQVATPAEWKPGEACMVQQNLTDEEARRVFPDFETFSLRSGRDYMRITKNC